MCRCPRCGCVFEPKKLSDKDEFGMIFVRCPSCRENFSIKLEYISIQIKQGGKQYA